jgi:hypothetical protein
MQVLTIFVAPEQQGVAEGSDISGLLAAANLNKSFIITIRLQDKQKSFVLRQ